MCGTLVFFFCFFFCCALHVNYFGTHITSKSEQVEHVEDAKTTLHVGHAGLSEHTKIYCRVGHVGMFDTSFSKLLKYTRVVI